MKWILGVAAIGVALGAWAGFRADGAALIETRLQIGLAVFFACQILFGLWVLYRAKPGSGDRMVLPTALLGSASMLVIILPRLLWPDAGRVHIASSVVSLVVMATTGIVQYLRRRARAYDARSK